MKPHLRILSHPLFERFNTKIHVACSGGPDSLATLDIFNTKFGTDKVVPFFIDHNTKGSYEGYLKVDEYCFRKRTSPLKFGIPLQCPSDEVSWMYARRNIYKLILENKNNCIVTGHHLDDAVEEYAINWTKRGTSDTLQYKSSIVNLFRPMLINLKKDLIHYCDYNKINYYNSDHEVNLRNNIRKSSIFKDINELFNTNLHTLVRKKIHKDHELTRPKKMGPLNSGRVR